MREIKFRVWDTGMKVMASWEDLEGFYNHRKNKLWEILSGNTRYIPLQYTGLTDKNGVEIYEGDIVLVVPEEPEYNPPFKHAVNYSVAGYLVDVFGEDYDVTTMLWASEQWPYYRYEVIGNIYENPELMEDA